MVFPSYLLQLQLGKVCKATTWGNGTKRLALPTPHQLASCFRRVGESGCRKTFQPQKQGVVQRKKGMPMLLLHVQTATELGGTVSVVESVGQQPPTTHHLFLFHEGKEVTGGEKVPSGDFGKTVSPSGLLFSSTVSFENSGEMGTGSGVNRERQVQNTPSSEPGPVIWVT